MATYIAMPMPLMGADIRKMVSKGFCGGQEWRCGRSNALYHLINYFFVLHLIYRIPDAGKCPCIGIFFLAFGERIAVGLNNSCKTAETIQGQEAKVRAERLHTSPTSPGVHC